MCLSVCLYEVCVCMDIHCVLGIKVFTFMRVRVSVHCGQFTCDVCARVCAGMCICVHVHALDLHVCVYLWHFGG